MQPWIERSRPLFYGQHGEDYLLWHFFDFRPRGFFLDIGAHDGVALSNTKSFEDCGWSGICVEPVPRMAAACRQIRKRVVEAACVAGPEKQVTLHVDRSALYAGIASDPASAQRGYTERGLGSPDFQQIEVPAMRACELLNSADPAIDFASVDVEGTEIDVLEGLDLARNQPRVLVVEALTEPSRDRLDAFLGGFGYRRSRSVVCNHFYVLNAKDDRKLRAITIDCRLVIPELANYGPAELVDRAWSAPATRTRIGFVLGKLRQRYRRWAWGV